MIAATQQTFLIGCNTTKKQFPATNKNSLLVPVWCLRFELVSNPYKLLFNPLDNRGNGCIGQAGRAIN